MKPTLLGFRTALFSLLAAAAVIATIAATPFHFALIKSMPTDKATVHEFPEVKLWFSEAPEDGTVSIHLLDEEGEPVPATDVVQDPEAPTAFSIRPSSPPPAATYTVSWRGMGDDGHVVRGELKFTVAGH